MGRLWHWLLSALSRAPRDELDPDIREIFLAELDELSETLAVLMPAWRAHPNDTEVMRGIRRAFHTVKGSGQMAGARNLGMFCGRIEKLTLQLSEHRTAPDPEDMTLVEAAVRLLPQCSRSLRDGVPLPAGLRHLDRQATRRLGLH